MKDLASLLCGNKECQGTAKTALDQLSLSIEGFATKALQFLKEPTSEDTLRFGPFCARVLLENSCAALVGRFDSFRMLYLSEFQAQPEYEHGRRAKSAFSWNGDVLPDDRGAGSLWSLDTDIPKISRALLSKHFDHIYWKPAVESMLDYVSTLDQTPSTAELLAIDADTFVGFTRGTSMQLYSTLSKSVHWEFFTNALVFDETTVKNAIRDTCLLVGRLGLISHFVPTAYASLAQGQAMQHYLKFREQIS